MTGKNRNTEEIAKFCKEFRTFCEEVEREAKDLKLIASAAESSLRDKVGTKAIGKVQEFADEILSIVYRGEERIRELEMKNNRVIDKMNEVEGMIR